MIDSFIEVLESGARLGLISFDERTVRAPHHDVTVFDAEALSADAQRLRAVAVKLDAGETRADARTFGDDWDGRAGLAAVDVAQTTTGRMADAIAELVGCADALGQAVQTVGDVLTRYRSAMATVCDPGVVAHGGLSPDDARAELIARMEYAAAVGRIASSTLVDVVALSASTGELVLAGDR